MSQHPSRSAAHGRFIFYSQNNGGNNPAYKLLTHPLIREINSQCKQYAQDFHTKDFSLHNVFRARDFPGIFTTSQADTPVVYISITGDWNPGFHYFKLHSERPGNPIFGPLSLSFYGDDGMHGEYILSAPIIDQDSVLALIDGAKNKEVIVAIGFVNGCSVYISKNQEWDWWLRALTSINSHETNRTEESKRDPSMFVYIPARGITETFQGFLGPYGTIPLLELMKSNPLALLKRDWKYMRRGLDSYRRRAII